MPNVPQGTAFQARPWRPLPTAWGPVARVWARPPAPFARSISDGSNNSGGSDVSSSSSSSSGGSAHSRAQVERPQPPPRPQRPGLHTLLLAAAGAATALLLPMRARQMSAGAASPPRPQVAACADAAAVQQSLQGPQRARGRHSSYSSRPWQQRGLQPAPAAPLFASVTARGGASTSTATATPLAASRQQQQQPVQCAVAVQPAAAGTARVQHEAANRQILSAKATLALQQVMAAHVVVKILAVFLVAAPIVYAGGALYSLITGSSIQLGILKIYSVVIRVPGAKVTEEKSLPAFLLMNFFFILGVFSFAVLIGIVSEEIKSQVKSVRSGNYPVVAADHTLILNWNRSALPLLRNIADSQHGCDKSLGRELVLLADQSKDSMDAEIMSSQKIAKSGLKVVTREGSPHCVQDLDSVSAGRAKTIIVLHPDGTDDADTKKASAILGLEVARGSPVPGAAAASTGEQRIILQRVPGDPGQQRLFSLVKDSVARGRQMELVEVNGSRNLARLIAQSAVQPGVANIYSSIAQSAPGAPDFHLRECGAELGGRSYAEARRGYSDAVVCGYVSRSDGSTHLNPPDSTQLQSSDRLIILAHGGNPQPSQQGSRDRAATAGVANQQELTQRLRGAAGANPVKKKIVVLGWKGHMAELAAALEDFAAPGSEVVLVSRWRPADMPGRRGARGTCTFRFVKGSPFDHEVCRRAGVGRCDSIIIGTLECDDGKAADARMLASLLVVQDVVSASPATPDRPPHVVAAIHRSGTVRMARHILGELGRDRLTAELLTPNELVSGMLLQVANEPGLAPALLELIDSTAGGTELQLRRPQRFNLDPSRPTLFGEVVELARLRGETALGYLGEDGSLLLAPEASSAHLYTKGSRVVVMANSRP